MWFLGGTNSWKRLKEQAHWNIKNFVSPFINNPSSQYYTILTDLRIAYEKFQACDQSSSSSVIIFDQSLYTKSKKIVEKSPNTNLNNVVVRFSILMSFMGIVGVIMGGSGLKELHSTIYAENSDEFGHGFFFTLKFESYFDCLLQNCLVYN